MGQDGHDRGLKVVATAYADLGFEVVLCPFFLTPEEVAQQAIKNKVHALGISSLSGGHKILIPQVIKFLKSYKGENIVVIAGGIIPKQDHSFLYNVGVTAIFNAGVKISDTAIKLLQILNTQDVNPPYS